MFLRPVRYSNFASDHGSTPFEALRSILHFRTVSRKGGGRCGESSVRWVTLVAQAWRQGRAPARSRHQLALDERALICEALLLGSFERREHASARLQAA